MYLPSDLANQYNEKHSCDKRFNNWLRSSQTVDYLNYINNKVVTQKNVSTFKDEKWMIAILMRKYISILLTLLK